jgi:prepilin-type N-terminal cleavage/methylation domain-containing protein/prepilin-type processing-associated H-X9-DG protein
MKKAGFTLIELLVVITVIGLLVGLSVPAIGKALQKANDAKSTANLRQIGIGLNGYATENDNLYPLAGGTIPYKPDPLEGDSLAWSQQLEDYLGKDKKVYKNPKVRNRDYGYYLGSKAAQAESGGFGQVNKLRIPQPSKHILGGECLYRNFDLNDADPDDYSQHPSFAEVDGSVQAQKTQVLFADGHVETLDRFKKDEITTRYTGVGSDY